MKDVDIVIASVNVDVPDMVKHENTWATILNGQEKKTANNALQWSAVEITNIEMQKKNTGETPEVRPDKTVTKRRKS